MAPKGKNETDDKVRDMVKAVVAEVIGERDKQSRGAGETAEQKWLRTTIREELGDLFEDFVKGFNAPDDDEKGEDKGDEPGEGFSLKALMGGRG